MAVIYTRPPCSLCSLPFIDLYQHYFLFGDRFERDAPDVSGDARRLRRPASRRAVRVLRLQLGRGFGENLLSSEDRVLFRRGSSRRPGKPFSKRSISVRQDQISRVVLRKGDFNR